MDENPNNLNNINNAPDSTPPPETPAPSAAPQNNPTPDLSPNPASTPNPTAPSAPISTPETPIISTPTPKKSRKTPLIIACAVGAVAVIGGVAGAIAFGTYYNAPETIAADAVVNLFKGEPMSLTGSVAVNFGASSANNTSTSGLNSATIYTEAYGLESLTLELTGDLDSPLPASSQLVLTATAGGRDYRLALGQAMSKDGVIYLRVSDLRATLDQVFADYKSEFSTSFAQSVKYFDDIIDQADDQWYEVNIPDLLNKYKTYLNFTSSEVSSYQDFYSCAVNVMNTAPDYARDLADVYRHHPFLTVRDYSGAHSSQHGGTLYNFDINAEKTRDFLKDAINTQFLDDIVQCMDTTIARSGASASSTTMAEELAEYRASITQSLDDADLVAVDANFQNFLEKLPDYAVEIDGSHHIVGFYLNSTDSSATTTAAMHITYGKSLPAIPADAKPLSDLIDDVITLLNRSAIF